MLNKTTIIEKYLRRLGRSVTLVKEGSPTEVFAVIEQTWKRNKSRFERNSSKIGRWYNAYYIYYGPASYDIRALGTDDYAVIDGVRYYFVQAESVKAGNIIQYYRGVLKKEMGDSDEFI
ncbi:MAG: hypothetical protein II744_05125 [Eubacterium sp.]|nr:hypothetical protein [Eubacterium sp.]